MYVFLKIKLNLTIKFTIFKPYWIDSIDMYEPLVVNSTLIDNKKASSDREKHHHTKISKICFHFSYKYFWKHWRKYECGLFLLLTSWSTPRDKLGIAWFRSPSLQVSTKSRDLRVSQSPSRAYNIAQRWAFSVRIFLICRCWFQFRAFFFR